MIHLKTHQHAMDENQQRKIPHLLMKKLFLPPKNSNFEWPEIPVLKFYVYEYQQT